MGVHVHDPFQDEHIERWGAERMRRHLRDVHEMPQLPMAWDIGRLHQAHLDAHQAVKRAAAPEPESEDPQVCGSFYGLGGGLAGQCARPVNHPPISVDGIGHNQQPIPIQPTAEEAPMTQTGTRPVDADDGPRKLYEASDERKEFGTTWDDLGQESRDFWRGQYVKQSLTRRVPLREADPDWDARQQEAVRQDEDRRVTVDRIVCTLAGLDFDRDWAADSGMGPNARGAIRKVYVEQAEKLLTWLERGGAMALPGYASIGTDLEREQALVTDLEQINNDLREQLATTGRQLQMALSQKDGLFSEMGELRQQMAIDQREHGASLDAVQRQLEEARVAFDRMNAQRVSTEQELQTQLEEMTEKRRRAMEETVAANARASELSTQLDLLSGDLSAVTAMRDGLQAANDRQVRVITDLEDALGEATDERDRAQQAAMNKYGETGEIRQALADLVADLNRDGWSGSSVYQRLAAIVAMPVSTVTEASQDAEEIESTDAWLCSDTTVPEPENNNLLWAKRFAETGEI